MRVSELCAKCGYEFFGPDIDVQSICYAHVATPRDIALPPRSDRRVETEAKCLLIPMTLEQLPGTLIFPTEDMDVAPVRLAQILCRDILDRNTRIDYILRDGYYVGQNCSVGKNTSIGPNVYMGNDVCIGSDCSIAPGVRIGSGTVIGDGVRIGSGSSVGEDSFYQYYDGCLRSFPGIGRAILSDRVTVGCHTVIQRGSFSDTLIGAGTQIGNLVDVGHDVRIGKDCKIVSQTGISSHVQIGHEVCIYGQVGISNEVQIGDRAVILARSGVASHIPAGQVISGVYYARDHHKELRTLVKIRKMTGE